MSASGSQKMLVLLSTCNREGHPEAGLRTFLVESVLLTFFSRKESLLQSHGELSLKWIVAKCL